MLAARIENTFTATTLIQGGCKATDFNDWLDEVLCPRLSENHVVIMDNARLHKTARTRELIGASGAELMFLPLIHPIITRLNTTLPISNENGNITQKNLLKILFKCISNKTYALRNELHYYEPCAF
ncbi:hypothetical protein C6503_17445 [Candidatus Poribacteria bacterium]|nr:MAG: hypothetical protein C6503_17445 [Candidatus Poribacteria bacterium]